MLAFLLNTLKIIFLLGFLVFIHEGGHFLIAKLFKVKVNEFAIGFGPVIWSKQGKETKYALRLIPLGGFVDLLGEEVKSDDEHSYNNASIFKRILILLAGGLVNIVFGIIIFFILITSSNEGYISTVVNKTIPNYSAEEAGIKSGDKILKVNGKKIHVRSDINNFLLDNQKLTITVKRNNEIKDIQLLPTKVEQDNQVIYMIGIEFEKADATFKNRLYYGFWETTGFLKTTLQGLVELFTGRIQLNQLTGPVGISEMVAKTEQFSQYVYILALISVSLGMTNLLPVPPLDGGKIFILLIEGIRKKPFDDKTEAMIQLIGMCFIFGLTIIVTFNDITRTF